MLTLARETRGLTQSQLASKATVSQGYISKVEQDLLTPSDDHLARIAAVLDYPISFFERQDQVMGFGSPCIYHRKQASLPVGYLRQVQAQLNLVRISLSSLLADLEIETEHRFHRMDVDEYAVSGDGPEVIARLIRGNWQLPFGPVRNLVQAIESSGGIVVRYPFGTRKLDAVSQWPRETPPIFLINDAIPTDRMRWTLAHELGHVLMHFTPTLEMEDEADRFASEFLMPEAEIGSQLDGLTLQIAAELKPYWKVSIQAIIRRAFQLGRITASRYKSLFIQLSKLGYRKSEPITLPQKCRLWSRSLSRYISKITGTRSLT